MLHRPDLFPFGLRFLFPAQLVISIRQTYMRLDKAGALKYRRALPFYRKLVCATFESDPPGESQYPRVGGRKLKSLPDGILRRIFPFGAGMQCAIGQKIIGFGAMRIKRDRRLQRLSGLVVVAMSV